MLVYFILVGNLSNGLSIEKAEFVFIFTGAHTIRSVSSFHSSFYQTQKYCVCAINIHAHRTRISDNYHQCSDATHFVIIRAAIPSTSRLCLSSFHFIICLIMESYINLYVLCIEDGPTLAPMVSLVFLLVSFKWLCVWWIVFGFCFILESWTHRFSLSSMHHRPGSKTYFLYTVFTFWSVYYINHDFDYMLLSRFFFII